MLSSNAVLLPLFGSVVLAANLWATHYAGTVNYLTFSGSALTLTSSTKTNNAMPSWITYDSATKALYIPDENFMGTAGGTLVAFSVGSNGTLTANGKGSAPQGAVASALYGGKDGKSFIALVHYQNSQLTTFKLPLTSGNPLQTLKYTIAQKGPNSRQDASHPHHAVVDPTGDYLLVPDLGADLIRIHKIDHETGKLTECGNGKTAPGAGPRHAVFWSPAASSSSASLSRVRRATTYTLFVANELGNSLSSWAVSYASATCLELSVKQTLTPYSGNATAVKGTKVGEVKVKDNFVYTTNRNDKKFSPNDSITQYTIASDGTFTWTETTSSYGTYPRTFDINKAGDYVAIGDQTTSNVAIVARDPKTGKLGTKAGDLRLFTAGTPESEDGTSAVVWAE